jgi:antitoxin YefM
MQTIQASDFQNQLSQLSKLIIQQHQTVRLISKQEENMIVMSERDYDSLQETLYLLSNAHNAEHLRQAQQEPLNQAIKWEAIKSELQL